MMRYVIFAVACAMLSTAGSVADAADVAPDVTLLWYPGGQGWSAQTSVRLSSSYTIGYDGEPCTVPWGWYDSEDTIWAWFWREAGVDGWNAGTAWCWLQNVPVPSRGTSLVVPGLYAWQGLSYRYDTFTIHYAQDAFPSPWEWHRTLRLVRVPDGISYSGPFEWDLPLAVTKVGMYQLPGAVLPAYRTDDPLTGYRFEIEIGHVVPEPSSAAAILAALAGCAATMHRRTQQPER